MAASGGEPATSVFQEYDLPKAKSGYAIGESNLAFDHLHVWGPDKGSRTCPMCFYGNALF